MCSLKAWCQFGSIYESGPYNQYKLHTNTVRIVSAWIETAEADETNKEEMNNKMYYHYMLW